MAINNQFGFRSTLLVAALALLLLGPAMTFAQSGSRNGGGGGGSRSSSRGGRGGGGGISRGISRSRSRNLSGSQRYAKSSYAPKINAVTVPGTGFAVIEMFSSFDCEKCEQADKNLAWISSVASTRKLPVYTLSFDNQSNDSGNSIGNSRQGFYKSGAQSSNVQVIINGLAPLTGDKQSAATTIQSALSGKSRASLKISTTVKSEKINVTLKWKGRNKNDVIHIALAEDMGKRGDAMPINLVRDFKTIEVRRKDTQVTFKMPENFDRKKYHVVAYMQSVADSSITAAAKGEFK